MPMPLRQPMTREEFLVWEDGQDLRHEFDGIRPVAMTGGTRAHSIIQNNLHMAIGTRLRGSPCRFFGNDLRIEAGRSFRYPDGFVLCTPGRDASSSATDPVVIFEVLSPSTAGTDQITKNEEYAAIPSVRRYVMLAQDRVGATVFERRSGDWVGHVVSGNAVLAMPEIGIDVPLAELYDGLNFDGEPSPHLLGEPGGALDKDHE